MVPEILHTALRFFIHRDEMNAAIHTGAVRWSPITVQFAEWLVNEYGDLVPDARYIIDGENSDD